MSVFKVKLTQGIGRTAQGALDTFAAGNSSGGTLSTASWAGGVITFTTSGNHGFATNTEVAVNGVTPTNYNGVYTITSVPLATTFTVNSRFNPGTYTSGGVVSGASVQRGVWIMGPNRINRLLLDGAQFSDCNYWKRFTYPTLPYESAFIEVVTDDGSPYSDYAVENMFPVAYNGASHDGFTVSHTTNATIGAAVVVNILGDQGNYAAFTQIEVTNSDVYVRINGGAIIKIISGGVQTFDSGDLPVGKLEFYNTTGVDALVSVVASVQVVCNS
jgi:hypothetical protein